MRSRLTIFITTLIVCLQAAANPPFEILDRKCTKPNETRWIDGMEVRESCWQESYKKVFQLPSKNDCNKLKEAGCMWKKEYLLEDAEQAIETREIDDACLVTVYLNGISYCVNEKREYICKKSIEKKILEDKLILDPEDKEAPQRLLCEGLPCGDGSCVDSSYDKNEELGEALASLKAAVEMSKDVSMMQGANMDYENISVNIFKGDAFSCSNKMLDYTDCCLKEKGWGKKLGARCSAQEKQLAKLVKEKRCIEIGEICVKKILGKCVITKKKYCCYENKFSRIINEQVGRHHLGTPQQPICRGFTKEEISSIDFSKVDLTEFVQDIQAKANEVYAKMVKNMANNMSKSTPGLSQSRTNSFESGTNLETFKNNLKDNENHIESADKIRDSGMRDRFKDRSKHIEERHRAKVK
ncbi:MAG: type-F conjugative transfer system mating-pair stabilization protein TraN [Rickettsiaceae bacterium]|nr:type-F conjugative transfer system mating-pair stabilization protein TraN [Rickettsiaceae bacterium]